MTRRATDLDDLALAAEARLTHGDRAGAALLMVCSRAAERGDLIEFGSADRAARIVERHRDQRIDRVRAVSGWPG